MLLIPQNILLFLDGASRWSVILASSPGISSCRSLQGLLVVRTLPWWAGGEARGCLLPALENDEEVETQVAVRVRIWI